MFCHLFFLGSSGSVTFRIESTKTAHSGLYYCRASGFDTKGLAFIKTVRIRLMVYTSAGHVAISKIIYFFLLAWKLVKLLSEDRESTSDNQFSIYSTILNSHSCVIFILPP